MTRKLSAKELLNAREAAIHRSRMEQLYDLVRDSILFDLCQPPGPQLIASIHRAFDTHAVAMFDAELGRLDRVGNWNSGEEELAMECYLHGGPPYDPGTELSRRVLRARTRSLGALVVCGDLSPLVVDTLASLAVITMERYRSFEPRDGIESRPSEPLRAVVTGKNGAGRSPHALIRLGQIELDPVRRRVMKDGRQIHLTPKEFEMLHCLMHDAGKPVPHEQLLKAVWGPEYGSELEYLRTFARQLRKKIEDDPANPKYLQVDASIGYRFNESEMST